MATLLNKSFTFYEVVVGYNASGDSVESVLSQREVRGTVQPINGQETVSFFGGSRNSGSVKVYSSEKLCAREEGSTTKGYVKADGKFYELVDEIPYTNMKVVSHYKYIGSFVPQSQVPGVLQ